MKQELETEWTTSMLSRSESLSISELADLSILELQNKGIDYRNNKSLYLRSNEERILVLGINSLKILDWCFI